MAVGAIGMSLDDFCRYTPAEFRAVADAFREAETQRERSGWERTRMQCVCMLQPYSSHKIDPQELMLFPWEDESDGQDKNLTTEEIRKRFEKAKKEQGLL